MQRQVIGRRVMVVRQLAEHLMVEKLTEIDIHLEGGGKKQNQWLGIECSVARDTYFIHFAAESLVEIGRFGVGLHGIRDF